MATSSVPPLQMLDPEEAQRRPETAFEPDRPPTLGIGAFVFFVVVFLVGVFIAVAAFVKVETVADAMRRNAPDQTLLDGVRQAAESKLTTYGIVDESKGVYRVPADVAAKVVLEHPNLLGALPAVHGKGSK